MKDYYSILGVQRSAGHDEIKRAYRRLAVLYHPDKNPDPSVESLFKEINEAYDVLGDGSKRTRYDQRLANPFATEFVVEEEPPRHRDPAYRRKTTSRPRPKRNSDTYELMKQYLPYVKWISWVSVAVTFLFFIDYVLPYRQFDDRIDAIGVVRSQRNNVAYYVAHLASGKRVKYYEDIAMVLRKEMNVRWTESILFSTPMWIEPEGEFTRFTLAYAYGPIIFLPLMLMSLSVIGIVSKKNIELCFNVNIVGGILLIIFLILV